MQNALIFKLANLKGAVLTQIILQLATAGNCKLNKGIRNTSRIDELKKNPNIKLEQEMQNISSIPHPAKKMSSWTEWKRNSWGYGQSSFSIVPCVTIEHTVFMPWHPVPVSRDSILLLVMPSKYSPRSGKGKSLWLFCFPPAIPRVLASNQQTFLQGEIKKNNIL